MLALARLTCVLAALCITVGLSVRPALADASFTAADVKQCLRIAAGLAKASADEASRYNLAPANAAITVADAVLIARQVAIPSLNIADYLPQQIGNTWL
jgi:hypothetical protein